MRGESTFSEINSLSVSVTLNKRVESSVKNVHLFVEIASFFVHLALDKLACDLVELFMRDGDVVSGDAVGSFGRKATFQVKLDSCGVVTFSLFHFSSFSFLVCLQQPLEVIVFELTHILMLELLSNLDGLVPPMQLLIHSHSFFNLVVLDQDRFSLVELLVQHSKFSLNSKVVSSFLRNQLV